MLEKRQGEAGRLLPVRAPPEVQCTLPSLPPESCCRPCAPVAPILLHPFLFPGPYAPTSVCLGKHHLPRCSQTNRASSPGSADVHLLAVLFCPTYNVSRPSVSQCRGEFVLEKRWLTRRVGFLNPSMGVVVWVVAEAAECHSPADARQLHCHVPRSRL